MIEYTVEDLYDFLKENDAYDKYLKNSTSEDITHVEVACASLHMWPLSWGFWWGDTKEGLDYWNELDNKFHDIFIEKI